MTLKRTCIIVFFIYSALSMHLLEQSDYLKSLEEQQKKFVQGTKQLQTNIENLDKGLQEAKTIKQKINLIESSLINEENKVYTISTKMIPPLDLSKCTCNKLTLKDRAEIKTQAQTTLSKIKQLQQKLLKLEQAEKENIKTKEMNRDIQSQIFYLQEIIRVVDSNCKEESIISPTVFQTNIYAPNWILGSQTISNVVNQYIQRTMQYDNITNCPKQNPFFNGSHCLNCEPPTPLFNIQTVTCVACSEKTIFDEKKRNCIQNANFHNNLFTYQPWITNNEDLNKVYTDYNGQVNKPQPETKEPNQKEEKLCPQNKPFIINQQCASCELGQIYNIDLKKCVIPKQGLKYDHNVRKIITPQTFKETNPQATNLIAIAPLNDNSGIQNCPTDRPYWDGIACIKCQKPFDKFDLSFKRCVECSAQTIYDSDLKSCKQRPKNYLNNPNDPKILGTSKLSTTEYAKKIQELKNKSENDIDMKCQDGTYRSQGKCIKCEENQYFNAQTEKCFECNNIDKQSKTCLDGAYIKPNVEAVAKTIVGSKQGDADTYLKNVQQKSQQNPDKVFNCPSDRPYATQKQCVKCEKQQIFDITSLKCIVCPEKHVYNAEKKICESTNPTVFLTNSNAKNIVGSDVKTVDTYLKKQNELSATAQNKKQCPEDTPFSDGTKCIKCQQATPLFDITTLKCSVCPQQQPHYKASMFSCIACPQGSKFNKKSQICQKTSYVTNAHAPKIVSSDTQKVKQYFDAQIKQVNQNSNAQQCPLNKPYSVGGSCISCEDGDNNLFNMQTMKCQKCPDGQQYSKETYLCATTQCLQTQFFNDQTKKCEEKPNCQAGKVFSKQTKKCQSICKLSETFNQETKQCENKCKPTQNYNSETKQCEAKCKQSENFNEQTKKCQNKCKQTEKYNADTKLCENLCKQGQQWNKQLATCQSLCKDTQIWNAQSKSCVEKPTTQFVSKLDSKNNWIASNYIQTLKSNQQAKKVEGAKICPTQKPFSTGTQCIACPKNNYFDVLSKICKQCPVNTQYNQFTHECRGIQAHKTNLDSTSLIFDGFAKGQLQYNQNKAKQQNPSMTDCPNQKPYWDGHDCISCPTEKPYFNVIYRLCQQCSADSKYDQRAHECLSSTGKTVSQGPKLVSLAAGVFSHKQLRIHRLN